ncbi:MAG TPA: SLBB domain-containing protein, partial [Armatimonadota bacterium]|nr:SLBB domain-containing protein [Armatimonadota bacterium]
MRLYFSRAEQIVAALLVLAMLAALGVLVARQRHGLLLRAPEPLLQGAAGAAQPLPAAPAAESGPVVHVVGAVQRPGVYTLAPNARVQDAVRAAGGARADGAPDALNLADHAIDGSRIEVPTAAAYQQLRAEHPAPPLIVAPPPPRSSAMPPAAVKLPPTAPVQPYAPLVTTEAVPPAPATTAAPPAARASSTPRTPAIVHLNTATQAELETLPA